MTYDVLIQPQPEGVYRATVLGWPELSVVGNSEQTAIERVRQVLKQWLAQGKIVRIEVDEPVSGTDALTHPWLPFLGMWRDDPTFDSFLARMEAYRHELDETPG